MHPQSFIRGDQTLPRLPDFAVLNARNPNARSRTLDGLLNRHSVGPRWLAEPAPSTDQLERAIACALRAPDHGQLVPWRAVLVKSDQREALGQLFAEFAAAVGKPPEEIDRERERAVKGPALLAWVARITPGILEVPEHEQWITVGGALTNFLNAVHLMGFAAKTLSGRKCQHPAVSDAFCQDGEQLVAFVCVGTPTKQSTPRGTDDVASAWTVWKDGNNL
jgi:nitroreductase